MKQFYATSENYEKLTQTQLIDKHILFYPYESRYEQAIDLVSKNKSGAYAIARIIPENDIKINTFKTTLKVLHEQLKTNQITYGDFCHTLRKLGKKCGIKIGTKIPKKYLTS